MNSFDQRLSFILCLFGSISVIPLILRPDPHSRRAPYFSIRYLLQTQLNAWDTQQSIHGWPETICLSGLREAGIFRHFSAALFMQSCVFTSVEVPLTFLSFPSFTQQPFLILCLANSSHFTSSDCNVGLHTQWETLCVPLLDCHWESTPGLKREDCKSNSC